MEYDLNKLNDFLISLGYECMFSEPFGDGERTLYRSGDKDIFIESVEHTDGL